MVSIFYQNLLSTRVGEEGKARITGKRNRRQKEH